MELLESVRGLKKITRWPPYSPTPRPSPGLLPHTTLVDATDHGVTSSAFAAAPSARLIWFHHAAREDRTIRFKSLPGHAQTEAVESSEGGQVRAAEAGRRGSVGHVEVFRMGGVGTPIIGRPRPLPSPTRPAPTLSIAMSR